jgi:hypothetical protein
VDALTVMNTEKMVASWQPYTPGAVITDDNTNTSVEIRALRTHPNGLGCSAENIYEWTFDKKVQNQI